MHKYKNKAFISYRHSKRDMKIAKMLQQSLEEYRIPKEVAAAAGVSRIGRIFRDQTDLGAQADLSVELRRELADSEFLIVVCSPEAAGSRWVSEEVACYLESHSANGIIAVLSQGEPEEILPKIFGRMEEVPRELVACDFRGSRGRALREEIPRIASSLIGCRYDELLFRNRRYRRRRTAILAAAAFALLAGIFTYGAAVRAQYQRDREKLLAAEAADLAKRSEEALKRRNRLEAVRNALAALPDPEERKRSRPVVGEAVLALQNAVGAYIPEENRVMVQTGEFAAAGQIDDWDCGETDMGSCLAVQYEDGGCYDLAVWTLESGRKIYDSGEAAGSSPGRDGDYGTFLLTKDMILRSHGEWLSAISLESAAGDGSRADVSAPAANTGLHDGMLWNVRTRGAEYQRILADSEELFAVHVSGLAGYGQTDDLAEQEEIQIRRKADGLAVPAGTIHPEGGGRPEADEGYTELPGAAFAGGGRLLVYEEDWHFYTDDASDRCLLFLADLQTSARSVLAEEEEILDFAVCEEGSGALVVSGDDAVRLKYIRISDGKEEWAVQADCAPDDFVCLISGAVCILVTGKEAAAYDPATGELLAACTFPETAAAAYLSEATESVTIEGEPSLTGASAAADFEGTAGVTDTGKTAEGMGDGILHILSEDGDDYAWDFLNPAAEMELQPTYKAFPEGVLAARRAGDAVLLQCSGEASSVSPGTIAVFREDNWDRELTRVSFPRDAASTGEGAADAFDDSAGFDTVSGFGASDVLSPFNISGAIASGRQFVVRTEDEEVFGIDAETGSILWMDDAGEDAGQPEHQDTETEADTAKSRRVTVEVQESRLWFRDLDRDITVEIPVTAENALDAEAFPTFADETRITATELEDGKLLLGYGDEAFVIDEGRGWVEMSAAGFLGYNPVTDTLLLRGKGALYIAHRYSWQELAEKGREILAGPGPD